jgi:hypothetical protein
LTPVGRVEPRVQGPSCAWRVVGRTGGGGIAVNPVLARWGTFRYDDIKIALAGDFHVAAMRLADRAGQK